MKTLWIIAVALVAGFVAIDAHAQAPVPNVPAKRTIVHPLAWDASPTPAVTYVLRRGPAPGKYDEMVELPGLTYHWTNSPAQADRTNYYVVASKNASGVESDPSNEIKVEPIQRPAPPNLRTAVPITVEIYRREPGQLWAKAITLGPFLDRADKPAEEFSAVVRVGKPEPLLPE